MTLDFSAYPNADNAIRARTQEFFELVGKVHTTDADLLRLIQQGVCLEARDANGNTALIWAGCYRRTGTVQALLAAGANIEARNVHCDTPLIIAARNGRTESVQAFLGAGANIEARNHHGKTPLAVAANHGHTRTVQALLATGANIEAQSTHGNTALDVTGQDAIKRLLTATSWHASYDELITHGTAPKSAEEVYHLLAVTPLVNPRDPVDYVGNIQRIFANAKWESKAQAQGILARMHRDGRINAETVDSILDNNFPEGTHRGRLTPRGQGIMR